MAEEKKEILRQAQDKEKVEKKEEKKQPEKPQDEKTQEKPKEEIIEKQKPSGKFKDLIKQIEDLSVLELSELVKELEDRFGVSAATPMAMASSGSAPAGESEEEEKTEFNIILKSAGVQKINVIKAVREITALGLKDAKDLVDAAPKEIKSNVKKEEAEEIKKKLESVGAEVELK